MLVKRYEWSENFRAKADAQSVGKAIEQLREKFDRKNDELLPCELVASAADPESPLHNLFTWDDGKAARLYRDSEARLILRSIRVVIVSRGDEKRIIGNVAVRTESSGSGKAYVPTSLAVHKDNLRKQMIDDAIRGLDGWRSRYEQLHGAKDALDHVERAIGALKKIRAEVQKPAAVSVSL